MSWALISTKKMSLEDDEISELRELFTQLQAEIEFILKKLPADSSGHADPVALSTIERRLFVRSVFSFIEAVVLRIKTGALLGDINKLSPDEIALIKEEDYELDDSGRVKTRKARLKFFGNLRFALLLAQRLRASVTNSTLEAVGGKLCTMPSQFAID